MQQHFQYLAHSPAEQAAGVAPKPHSNHSMTQDLLKILTVVLELGALLGCLYLFFCRASRFVASCGKSRPDASRPAARQRAEAAVRRGPRPL